MAPTGGVLKTATITVCGVNLLLIFYLTVTVFGPLWLNESRVVLLRKDASQGQRSSEFSQEQERFRRDGQIARNNLESPDLIKRVESIKAGLASAASLRLEPPNEVVPKPATNETRTVETTEARSVEDNKELQMAELQTVIQKTSAESVINPEVLADIPAACNAQRHVDYEGFALTWGLTYHKSTAAECCDACLQQAKKAKEGEKNCTIWVFCPLPGGCFSPDAENHKFMECWLKNSEEPQIAAQGAYSDVFRQQHRTAPEKVEWMGGVIQAA